MLQNRDQYCTKKSILVSSSVLMSALKTKCMHNLNSNTLIFWAWFSYIYHVFFYYFIIFDLFTILFIFLDAFWPILNVLYFETFSVSDFPPYFDIGRHLWTLQSLNRNSNLIWLDVSKSDIKFIYSEYIEIRT